MATHLCCLCGIDISQRDVRATMCFPCYGSWGKRTGAANAAAAVNRAVARGEIPSARTLTCVDCAKPALDYDHRDYNKPLMVVPVCRSCNKLRGPAIPLATQEA